jgi:hypothetical protein
MAKKSSGKKITRRKRKTKIQSVDTSKPLDTEQIFKTINKLQIERVPMMFFVADIDDPIVQNILKDLGLVYKRFKVNKLFKYSVEPMPEKSYDDTFENIEEMPDEIIE